MAFTDYDRTHETRFSFEAADGDILQALLDDRQDLESEAIAGAPGAANMKSSIAQVAF